MEKATRMISQVLPDLLDPLDRRGRPDLEARKDQQDQQDHKVQPGQRVLLEQQDLRA